MGENQARIWTINNRWFSHWRTADFDTAAAEAEASGSPEQFRIEILDGDNVLDVIAYRAATGDWVSIRRKPADLNTKV